MKIYFVKLGKGILYIAFIAIMSSMLMDFMVTMINVVIPESLALLRNICYLALPVFLVSLFTYIRRQNNGEMRRSYLEVLDDSPFSFGNELLRVLKGRDFLAELGAFVTILIPLSLSRNLMNTLLVVLTYTLFFILIDAGIWLLLHRKWAKERLHKPEKDGKG